MVAYVVEQLDEVTIGEGSPIAGMDLMSPYVWRENGGYRMLLRAVPQPLTPDQPTGVIAAGGRRDGLHFMIDPQLAIVPDSHGARPACIRPDHFALQAADRALQETYGVRPLVVRMGGTVPIAELFQRHLGLDTVFFSFSTADEDFHAPNEFFRVHRLHEGLEAWARYWHILGEVDG